MELLARVPIASNPLTATLRTTAPDKLPSFVGKPTLSSEEARRKAYAPLYRANTCVAADGDEVTNNSSNSTRTAAAFLSATWIAGDATKAIDDAVTTMQRLATELADIQRAPVSESAPPSQQPQQQQSQQKEQQQKQEGEAADSEAASKSGTRSSSRPRKILVSFNGGKDCMVILHLLCCTFTLTELKNHFLFFVHEPSTEQDNCNNNSNNNSTHGCEEFSEATQFRDWVVSDAVLPGVEFRVCRGLTLRDHLWQLVTEFAVESVLIGTRKTDPSGKWQAGCLSATTKSWPPVTLVSPIFSWSYHHIWEYTLNLDVPRCVLYDRGFTSLGPKSVTEPNEALLLSGGSEVEFAPAWRLVDANLERANRKSGMASRMMTQVSSSASVDGMGPQRQSSI